MLESTPRSTSYHVYNRRWERSCKKVFDLDFQGHAIKIEFFHYHRWIPWPRKHTHEKYFQKIRTGRQKSRGVVSTPPLGVFGWRNTLGICGLNDLSGFIYFISNFCTYNIIHAHVNTLLPQPAHAVNSRGPKSRAGLTAYPQFMPNAIPMAMTRNPQQSGISPVGIRLFRLSTIAMMQHTRSVVPNNWNQQI